MEARISNEAEALGFILQKKGKEEGERKEKREENEGKKETTQELKENGTLKQWR
jgi:hypothetical protein